MPVEVLWSSLSSLGLWGPWQAWVKVRIGRLGRGGHPRYWPTWRRSPHVVRMPWLMAREGIYELARRWKRHQQTGGVGDGQG